jgi:type IV secretion system protein VirD4
MLGGSPVPDSGDSSDRLVLGALAAFAGAVTTVWAGAVVAAVVTGHGIPHAITLSDAAQAAVRLPSHASEPALAWQPAVARSLPGPVSYWMATVAVVVAVGALVTAAVRFWRRSNDRGRVRLGLDTRARFATLKDLGPLLVTSPIPAGRLVLGRVHGKLVATEDARGAPVSARKAGGRQGDRGSVAMIGPARSGKTANTASAIRDWTGPAVVVSVRRDLMDATIEPRSACGKISVFDPAGITGTSSPSRWSPLRSTSTPAGAQKAAASLAAAIPRSGVEGGTDYWVAQAEILLTGLLAVGSLADDVTMNDVARWVFTTDMPSPGGPPSHVLGIIQKAGLSQEAAVRDHATWAIEHLNAVWRLDERVRSSIYATVQTVVKPWMDPAVAASAQPSKAGFVDLEWLDGGANTLYLVAPLADQARFAPVLGGLLGDLKDQAYSWEVSGRQLRSPLLMVIDEAGNMPLAWLPEVASTCSAIGILLVTIWQSKSQLDAAYGRLSDSVLTNHLTKIVFAGCSDESTLGYVSRLMGDEEVERRSTSFDIGGNGRRSVSESTQREALSPFHLLRQVRPGEAVLIHGTLPPAHMQARRWWEELPGGSRKPTTARRAVGRAVVALTTLRSDREG